MLLRLFKDFLIDSFRKKETKHFFDSKLGRLTCEFNRKHDEFFFWNTEVNNINKNKSKTSISIDGDTNSPFLNSLAIAHKIIETISDITAEVQKEIDNKFSEKKIKLATNYILDDISIYSGSEVDYELEYYSDKDEMISVGFKNNSITELDFY
jgi:hypothetical protein